MTEQFFWLLCLILGVSSLFCLILPNKVTCELHRVKSYHIILIGIFMALITLVMILQHYSIKNLVELLATFEAS